MFLDVCRDSFWWPTFYSRPCLFLKKIEFCPLGNREIEQLIEFWRQEECLWKVTNKNYLDIDSRKTAMLNISKKLGEI